MDGYKCTIFDVINFKSVIHIILIHVFEKMLRVQEKLLRQHLIKDAFIVGSLWAINFYDAFYSVSCHTSASAGKN